ncbi:MAG: LPS-assembly protein LptD, partial [Rhodoferax sp.]|nr:LPS-assembly protein LptD [Rhodoferax sp.]
MRFTQRDMRIGPPLSMPSVRRTMFGAALLTSLAGGSGHAQEALTLQPSLKLQETLAPQQSKTAPVFLRGDRLWGRPDLETVVEGAAELRKADSVIRAERLEYDQTTDTARATGLVRINRLGNVYEGDLLELKIETFEGFFTAPRYQFLQNDAHGQADRADFLDASRTLVHNATYTTCRRLPGPDWMPDWVLRAHTISLDTEEDVGIATGAVLSFKGVPVLPVPAISFPLSDRRKSGLLPPTLGFDNLNGAEIGIPYYWNIAPNRDATLTPTLMTARGLDLGAEFRYLEPTHSGTVRANYMAGDALRGSDRWGLAYTHAGRLSTGLQAVGDIGINLNLNRVGDDNYWRDFTRTSPSLTQRLLPTDMTASWGRGALSTALRVLK